MTDSILSPQGEAPVFSDKQHPTILLPLYDRFPDCHSLWLPERYLTVPYGPSIPAEFIVRYNSKDLIPDILPGNYLFLRNAKKQRIIEREVIYYLASENLRGLCTIREHTGKRIEIAPLSTGRFCAILPPEQIHIFCRVCAITKRL